MPTPPYIRKLRERIGSDYLWLSGATAVVYREQDSKVLLVRRSDNGAWTPITGIVDPGESPALTCLREAQEEANVQIEVLELAQVKVDPPMQFGNGDRCQFLDHTFLCRWVSGEARSLRRCVGWMCLTRWSVRCFRSGCWTVLMRR